VGISHPQSVWYRICRQLASAGSEVVAVACLQALRGMPHTGQPRCYARRTPEPPRQGLQKMLGSLESRQTAPATLSREPLLELCAIMNTSCGLMIKPKFTFT
jgi:hypothetical protein